MPEKAPAAYCGQDGPPGGFWQNSSGAAGILGQRPPQAAAGKDVKKQMGQAIRGAAVRLRKGRVRLLGRLRQAALPWAGYAVWVAAAGWAGAAVLPGGLAPFGLALCMAAPQEGVLLCSAGCVLGGFAALSPMLAVRQAVAALLIAALRVLLGRRGALWAGAAGVTAAWLFSRTAALLGQGRLQGTSGFVQGCLALALGILYRQLRPETWRADTPRRRAVLLAVWVSCCCCLAAPGLLGLPWLNVVLGLATLVLGALQREERLPLLWAGGALACLLLRADGAALLVVLCAGWCAGCLPVRGGYTAARRFGMAAAFFGLGLLEVFAAADLAGALRCAAANGVCSVLFCLLPERLFFRLEARLTEADADAAPTPSRTLSALASGLEAVGNGVEAVGRAGKNSGDPNAPIEAACAQVCSACTRKAQCWGAQYDTTQDVLQGFLQRWREDCSAEFPAYFTCTRPAAVRSALLRAENLRVLRAAGQVENGVLRRAVGDQYRAVADGLYRMAQSWQPQTALPQLESRVCALLNALQLPVRQLSAVRLADGSPQVELVLRPVRLGDDGLEELTREIGRCCGQPMIGLCTQTQAEGTVVQTLRFLPRPVCTARVGVASRALSGGVCGDVVEQLPQDTGLCVLLCDGMGTGPAAAMDAKMTALFTARLLRAGFDSDVAARLVNAALLSRAPGDRGSTLDALTFCGLDGSAVLYKAGACASFLRTQGGVRRLGGEAGSPGLGLPLGSAGTVRDASLQLTLHPGDWLVMCSDGVLAAGAQPLLEALRALQEETAAQAAEKLLGACLAGGPPQDDCTVAVIRILPGGAPQGRQTSAAAAKPPRRVFRK